ncbi:glycosyltransferase [Lutibacter sp.]|uniref:glycosyltransferase n=1 Tax=Lutibacter sp. TaxID=1925666 RepID=UPI001A2AE9C9|nr:glycosyltransferase [Lutibacter sp.]MBI9041555.1 glycosyltransferase [Lutibacter sp.]
MKILQVINSLNTGGAEKLLLEGIPLYAKKRMTMDILLLNGADTPFLIALKKQECCNIYSLGKGSVYNPFIILKLIPFLKKYDIIHVHLFPAQYFVVFAKLISFSKVPLIFTEHSTNNRRLESSMIKWIDKYIYKFYKRIICITEEVFKIIQKHSNLPKEKFSIIKNGVNVSVFKESTILNKNEIIPTFKLEHKVVIQVSSFQEPKDQPTLIKAMKHLPEYVKLILVGEGILRKECENLVRKLNLENRIFFLGIRTDVPQLLKSSDVVVLSSKYEGLSLASIEGMASGKPFIASNVPGLKEVVDGAGLLFPQGDEIALAEKITALITNEILYSKVAVACQSRALLYDINNMVEKHIALYQSIELNEKKIN